MKLVDQLRTEKKSVECSVSELITQFSEKTGFRITGVEIQFSFDAFGKISYNTKLEVSE